MSTRALLLTILGSSCVSSLVTLGVATVALPQTIRAAPDAQTTAAVMRAERFELVDAAGRVQAVLGSHDGVRGLSVVDSNGRARTQIGAKDDARAPDDDWSIVLRDEQRLQRVALSVRSNGVAGIEIGDNGAPAIRLLRGPAGPEFTLGYPGAESMSWSVWRTQSYLVLSDAAHHPRIVLTAGEFPRISIFNDAFEPLWQIP
jgi:hypothetical protein